MKHLSKLDQVNMLLKHAKRKGIVILNFSHENYNDPCVFANTAIGYITVFSMIENAKDVFILD